MHSDNTCDCFQKLSFNQERPMDGKLHLSVSPICLCVEAFHVFRMTGFSIIEYDETTTRISREISFGLIVVVKILMALA